MSARRAAAVGAMTVALAGCGGDEERQERPGPPRPAPRVEGDRAGDERVIRAWTRATFRGQYRRAGSYFASGAVVEQEEREYRLAGPDDAADFSASLPCRARVTGVVRDRRPGSLASFRLLRGPGGPCRGEAQVRFVIRRGKIHEWRQLPEPPPAAPGEVS